MNQEGKYRTFKWWDSDFDYEGLLNSGEKDRDKTVEIFAISVMKKLGKFW